MAKRRTSADPTAPGATRRARYLSLVAQLREECLGALALQASTRDEPVNLSASHLRTYQDWSPADASCCQSLLLDPDATIDIDLANGCSCWSPDEENSSGFFLTMDALYRLS